MKDRNDHVETAGLAGEGHVGHGDEVVLEDPSCPPCAQVFFYHLLFPCSCSMGHLGPFYHCYWDVLYPYHEVRLFPFQTDEAYREGLDEAFL